VEPLPASLENPSLPVPESETTGTSTAVPEASNDGAVRSIVVPRLDYGDVIVMSPAGLPPEISRQPLGVKRKVYWLYNALYVAVENALPDPDEEFPEAELDDYARQHLNNIVNSAHLDLSAYNADYFYRALSFAYTQNIDTYGNRRKSNISRVVYKVFAFLEARARAR
jgi:hypothetical protein